MQGHQMTDFGRLMAFLHTLLNDCLANDTIVGDGFPVPVVWNKTTLPLGNYRYFPSENPKMRCILGGTGNPSPTVLIEGFRNEIPIYPSIV
jgi:hypothetical protein